MSELQDYKNTGFTPEQINKMYENLTNTYELISKMICGDIPIMTQAVEDAKLWIDGYLSYCKKELN